MAMVSPMPPDATGPTVGTNCRCVFADSAVRGASRREEREREGGHRVRHHRDGVIRVTQLQISQRRRDPMCYYNSL
jgi:hypothetical protein